MGHGSALVSVIVRTKDRFRLLQCAVESVITQSYRPLELVVVNDGGEDVSQLLSALLAGVSDVTLTLIQHDKSVGRTAAANLGLQQASGQYGLFLDDDDYFDSGHIAGLMSAQALNTLDVVTHCRARAVSFDEQAIDQFLSTPEQVLSIEGDSLAEQQLFYVNSLPILTALFPLAVRDHGVAFDDQFDLFEDWDFWLQVSQVCSFKFVDQTSCAYRIHNSNSGVRDKARQTMAFAQIYNKWLPRLSHDSLVKLFCQSHAQHEAYIDQLQQLNQKHWGPVVNAHKDDAMRLRKQLVQLQGDYDRLLQSRSTLLYMLSKLCRWNPLQNPYIYRAARFVYRKLFQRKH